MGSSAQISSGVRQCGSQAQVPEGSRGFRRFWRVPESFGEMGEVAGGKVLEGLGRFRNVPES